MNNSPMAAKKAEKSKLAKDTIQGRHDHGRHDWNLSSLNGMLHRATADEGRPSMDQAVAGLISMPPLKRQSAVRSLQRTKGNQFVQRLAIQAKLKVGPSGDKYEQQAGRVADQVMRMPDPMGLEKGSRIQRAHQGCCSMLHKPQGDEDEPVQAKPISEQITPLAQSRAKPEQVQRHVTHSSAGRIGGESEFLSGSGGEPEGRYLFTLRGGWLDRDHVQPHAQQAIQVMANIEARLNLISVTSSGFTTRYNMSYNRIPAPLDQSKMEQVALAIMTDHDYRFEANQMRSVRNVAAQTPFSYEDLPSDRIGVEIGLRYRRQALSAGMNPNEGLDIGTSPQARLLQRVTQEVVRELQPTSAWDGIRLYNGFLQSQGGSVQPNFGRTPQGAPFGVIRPPMLPGLGWARGFFQGYSQLRQIPTDYLSAHPRHYSTSPYTDPTLSPVRNPAPFLVNQPPDWAWQAAGIDRNVFNRAIRELPGRVSDLTL